MFCLAELGNFFWFLSELLLPKAPTWCLHCGLFVHHLQFILTKGRKIFCSVIPPFSHSFVLMLTGELLPERHAKKKKNPSPLPTFSLEVKQRPAELYIRFTSKFLIFSLMAVSEFLVPLLRRASFKKSNHCNN